MKKHVTVVGAIHIGFGILGLMLAVATFFVFSFAMGMVGNEDIPVAIFRVLSSKSASSVRIHVNTWPGWGDWITFL